METRTSFYYHCPGYLQEEFHLLWVLGLHPRPDLLPMGRVSQEGWSCRMVSRTCVQDGWNPPAKQGLHRWGGGSCSLPNIYKCSSHSCKASPRHGCGSLCKIRAEVQLSKSAGGHDSLKTELSGKRFRRSQDLPVHGSVLASCADGAVWVLCCGTAVKICKCESSWVSLLVREKDQKGRTRGFLCGQG